MKKLFDTREKPAVLIVDDDLPTLGLFAEILKPAYRVYRSENARAAREVLDKRKIHLILCDHEMPGESGLSFLSGLRRTHPLVQRILLTGHTETEVFLTAINEGNVFKYLVKPSSPEEIQNAVKEALRKRKAMERAESIHQEHGKMKKEMASVPYMSTRMQTNIEYLWHFMKTSLFVAVIVFISTLVLGVVAFSFLYLLKCCLGIDIFKDVHLSDLFR